MLMEGIKEKRPFRLLTSSSDHQQEMHTKQQKLTQPPPGFATMLFDTLSRSPPGATTKTEEPAVE
jgi:hypothetical protein